MKPDLVKDFKYKKPVAVIAVVVICVAIIGSVYYNNVISVSATYKEAMSLYNEYNYEAAQEKFLKISDYKNSKKLAETCSQKQTESKYNRAVSLMKSEKYEEAMALFKELGTYNGSNAMFEQCRALIMQRGDNNKVDPYYTAYYAIVQNRFELYGEPSAVKQSGSKKTKAYTVKGVNLLKLVDLNKDGLEELVIGYSRENSGAGQYEIYSYINSTATLIGSGSYNKRTKNNTYYAFELMQYDGGYKIVTGDDDSGTTLAFNGATLAADCKWSHNNGYYLNGEKVTKDAYEGGIPRFTQFIYKNPTSPMTAFRTSDNGYMIFVTSFLTQSAATDMSYATKQVRDTLKASFDRTMQ